MAKATTRRRTDALYKPRGRRSSGKGVGAVVKSDRNEQQPRIPWKLKACADLVTKIVEQLSRYETYGDRCVGLNFEAAVASSRSTRNPDPDYGGKRSKSAAASHDHAPDKAAAAADWFVALKRLLVKRSCAPKRRTRSSAARDHAEPSVPPRFTRAMQREVDAALVPTPPHEVLVSAFRIEIKRVDLHTLADGQWLNDEVINFYMNLIAARSAERKGLPRLYAFSTFFVPKLIRSGYEGVSRWTRNVDIFAFDVLLVPLHFTAHWCLVVVDFRERRIAYYDSLGPPFKTPGCLTLMQRVADVPLQENNNDCGVFVCQYAECLSRDAPISFGQEDIPFFRRRVAYEILHKTILSA
ncbi:hypothetical protein MTO96_030143 [Rhipicephalus appendiculatus]